VVFDFGGVLWDMRWDVARALSEQHGLPRSSIFETLYRSDAWRDIERGIGDAEAWKARAHAELETRAGRALPALHEEWRRAQRPIAANLELVGRLRPPYKVSVLSNADGSLRGRLEDEMRIHHLFDDIVCSAQVGMAKPEPEIFRLAAGRLGLDPAECVFVDDWDQNIEAAKTVGMTAIRYQLDKGDDLAALPAGAGVWPRA
jgi:epoxide hydrolase-like predicted phosphatase